MSPRSLVVALLLVGLVATCVAKSKHRQAALAARREAEERMFNPLNMIKDVMNPTTRAPNPAMLTIAKAANAAVNTVDMVAGSITGMIDRLKGIQSMAKTTAEDTIKSVLENAQSLARKQGGEPGCVTELLGRASALTMEVALEEVECPGNKIGKLEDMLETLVQSGQSALTVIPKAAVELEKCERKGGPMEMICSAMVVKDMAARTLSVGHRASRLASDAIAMVATIEPSLLKCAGTKVGVAAAKAATLMGKLGMCSGQALKDLVG